MTCTRSHACVAAGPSLEAAFLYFGFNNLKKKERRKERPGPEPGTNATTGVSTREPEEQTRR